MPSVEIVGVYPIDADEPVHLVEIIVHDADGDFDIGAITQEMPDTVRSNWQSPYDEQILSPDGTSVLANRFDAEDQTDHWKGDVRLVFFFHYLELSKPLTTPFGLVPLTTESPVPTRLSSIRYEQP